MTPTDPRLSQVQLPASGALTSGASNALGQRDYASLAARIRAAAGAPLSSRVFGQQVTPDGAEHYDLLLVHVPAAPFGGPPRRGPGGAAGRPVGRRVYLNGGTHGDEPAGAEAVTRFLEDKRYLAWPDVEFTVTPCLNPWGYVHDRREGPVGRDLNRSFRRALPGTPEVAALKHALRRRVFDLFLDCHEDVDAPGLYVFSPAALGHAIVDAVQHVGPVHRGQDVDGETPLKDSVVELDGERFRERRRSITAWPLPFYVARYHRHTPSPAASRAGSSTGDSAAAPTSGGPADAENVAPPDILQMASATIETPTSLPLEQRVTMHLTAIDAAMRFLTS